MLMVMKLLVLFVPFLYELIFLWPYTFKKNFISVIVHIKIKKFWALAPPKVWYLWFNIAHPLITFVYLLHEVPKTQTTMISLSHNKIQNSRFTTYISINNNMFSTFCTLEYKLSTILFCTVYLSLLLCSL